jgi:hypothetical protein
VDLSGTPGTLAKKAPRLRHRSRGFLFPRVRPKLPNRRKIFHGRQLIFAGRPAGVFSPAAPIFRL